MSFDPQFTDLGKLETIEVYEYYDRPLLFSCKNVLGHVYVALLVDENDESEIWYYVGVSKTRFDHIRTGGIDLRTTFAEPEEGVVIQVEIGRIDNQKISVTRVSMAQVKDEFLPAPGEFLKSSTNTLPLLAESLVEKAQQAKREFIRLKLHFAGIIRTEAPSKQLGKILESLQEIVDAIGQALTGESTRKGAIPKNLLAKTELRVIDVGAGSFEVELASANMVNLFDESDAGNALNELIRLINIGNDAEQLKERLAVLKIRTAGKYVAFLNSLSDRVDSTSFELASPKNASLHHAQMSSATAQQVISIIEQADLEPPEDVIIRGTLIGANLNKKNYEIWARDSEGKLTIYAGRISERALNFVSTATLSREYTASLRATKAINSVTGEVEDKFELLSLE